MRQSIKYLDRRTLVTTFTSLNLLFPISTQPIPQPNTQNMEQKYKLQTTVVSIVAYSLAGY